MINFITEPPLVAGTLECPVCKYQRTSPGGKSWGIRIEMCKPCVLKEQVKASANPSEYVPPKFKLLYPRHR